MIRLAGLSVGCSKNNMRKLRHWKLLTSGLALLAFFIYGYQSMATGWETITHTFLRDDKPYGGGAFRIRDKQIISLKLADPKITFKPASEAKNADVAEPTEEWMNDTAELLNRGTVSFLRGSLDTGLTRTFQQRGQNAAWWFEGLGCGLCQHRLD